MTIARTKPSDRLVLHQKFSFKKSPDYSAAKWSTHLHSNPYSTTHPLLYHADFAKNGFS